MKKQAGMTLIELVIVIIVLGIIAAVAAPKFADIKADAAGAAKDGHVGAVDSAYTIAVAKVKGTPSVQNFMDQISGMTCDTVGFDNCDSVDKDGTAGADVAVLFYDAASCAAGNETSAGADSVVSYGFSYNGGATSDCRSF